MKSFITFFLFFVALVKGAIELDEGVLVLTDDNFEEAIGSHENILVEFYAPWCGHCKSLAPEWAKAAKSLAGSSEAKLAKLDATAHKEQAEKHGIRGFPTIKFFRNGKVSEYNGGRTHNEIVSWVNKRTGPATKTVNSADELSQLQENNEVLVLGVFDSADSAAAKGFQSLAGDDDSLVYAHTTDAGVKGKLGVTGEAVIVLKSFDDKRNDMPVSGSFDKDAVASFVAGNSVPLIQTFSQESSKKIFSSPVKTHILFFTDKSKDHHTETINTLSAIAQENKGKALFVNVPHSEKRVLDYFGITEEQLPIIVLADMAGDNMKKFPMEGPVTTDNVKSFMGKYFSGNLKPHLKSEEVQAEDTTGDVVILRGTSFADLVLNNDKDVLVEFYAPWCGHCKKLAPTYDEVGRRLKNVDSVRIAKIDATANEVDVPNLNVRGYPSIFFFKGNDKANPIKYEGGREADDFIEYISSNSHNKFSHDEL